MIAVFLRLGVVATIAFSLALALIWLLWRALTSLLALPLENILQGVLGIAVVLTAIWSVDYLIEGHLISDADRLEKWLKDRQS